MDPRWLGLLSIHYVWCCWQEKTGLLPGLMPLVRHVQGMDQRIW